MKKILMTALAAMALSFTACDSYLDVNDSPNSPSQSNLNANLIFPGAEMAFANSYGDYFRITGGYFAEQYSQFFGTSNYMDYSQFLQSATRSSSTYTNLCTRTLQNMKTVIDMAKENDAKGTILAATVIRVAAYQAMVDCYGEIPYSEALDNSNLTPKYDDGKDIYAGIISELDAAMEGLSGMEEVCTNFLLPGKRASEWIKVANALKLRLLMRESNVVNVQSQLAALIADNNFPTSDVAWVGCWSSGDGSTNPYYREEFYAGMQKNVILNIALLAVMNAGDDARLQACFDPNNDGKYQGGVSGTNFSTTTTYKANYWCRPSITFDSPVYFITRAEVEFFLAEYEARYGSHTAAENHYNAAIEASFAMAGASGANTVIKAFPYDPDNYAKCIGIQKWVHLGCCNNYEAWCEMRRLKFPTFGTTTGPEIYDVLNDVYTPGALTAGELYTPILVNANLGSNKILQRWPYPESSANRNANKPDYKGDASPVFWAQ